MDKMSVNNVIGNRNSTPETSHSSLRPPSSRGMGNNHNLRASADMASFASSPLSARLTGNNLRPSSEVYFNQSQQAQGQSGEDAMDKAAQQWIADIDQYETTLEEMAAATLDQDFKDELNAIEQWFKVLCEAERTAALYALLQQTTQVQIRFFIQVLQEMAKSHPMSGVLSPTSLADSDPMAKRMSDAMGKLSVEGGNQRSSLGRPPPSPGNKRNSGLDASTINAMFPDAANALAKKKAEYTQQTGNDVPSSNRNSTVLPDRTSLGAGDTLKKESNMALPSPTPWGQRPAERPKSSSGMQQPPMGQFIQPAPSPGLRSPRPPPSANLSSPDTHQSELPLLSPYNVNASWASMTNTPMVPNFNQAQAATQADMVANATAMKLAALSTVNNRIMLDDVRKYRRARSNDGQASMNQMLSPANVLVVNESGQLINSVNAQQLASLQMQQQAALLGGRSRPNSPGTAMTGSSIGTGMGFTSPQNNGYLSAYDSSAGLPTGMSGMSLGHFGIHGHEGYISDHSDARGRSPRGRRGTSKPPEDPTDLSLLKDIPAWLRSLRLHKYTDNLKDLPWTEVVKLDDKGLEDRGVNALGARRKMLKVFEQVQEAQAAGKL